MLLFLATIVLATRLIAAGPLPTFDVDKGCKAQSHSSSEMDTCRRQENAARDDLRPQWSDFHADDKKACVQETSMDGTPSYVELLTCLEMARDSRKAHTSK